MNSLVFKATSYTLTLSLYHYNAVVFLITWCRFLIHKILFCQQTRTTFSGMLIFTGAITVNKMQIFYVGGHFGSKF